MSFKSAHLQPPFPPKQSCFHFHLALRLKGINIEKGEGGGREGRSAFSYELEEGFYEEEVDFPFSVSTFLQLLVGSLTVR